MFGAMDPKRNLDLCTRSLKAVIADGDPQKSGVAERAVDEYLKHGGIEAIGVLEHAVDQIKTPDRSPQLDMWHLTKEYIALKRREARGQP